MARSLAFKNRLCFINILLVLLIQTHAIFAQINFSSIPCSQRNPKIVGGQEVEKHELPFIVSLTKRGGHFCGATIIHERWILTAGHCICNGLNKFMKPAQIKGVVGLHRISERHNDIHDPKKTSPVQIDFKDIIPHPQYKCENVKNDIALLELDQSIKFTLHVQPTCLTLDSGNKEHDNALATVSGWGWTNENQEVGQRSDILRKATVKIWSNQQCEQSYQTIGKRNSFITETQLCAGYENGGIDSCWADSGGPLMTKEHLLIGVVSTGIGCARPGLPGIYTRVSKYIKWMESVIQRR